MLAQQKGNWVSIPAAHEGARRIQDGVWGKPGTWTISEPAEGMSRHAPTRPSLPHSCPAVSGCSLLPPHPIWKRCLPLSVIPSRMAWMPSLGLSHCPGARAMGSIICHPLQRKWVLSLSGHAVEKVLLARDSGDGDHKTPQCIFASRT